MPGNVHSIEPQSIGRKRRQRSSFASSETATDGAMSSSGRFKQTSLAVFVNQCHRSPMQPPQNYIIQLNMQTRFSFAITCTY